MNLSTTRATTAGGRYANGTIASSRLRNSGVNIFLTASSCASSRVALPKPMLSRAMSAAPAFVVMMRIDVPEIDGLAVVVGELAVIHHLQQDVEQVRVRLLDLVEQDYAVRMLVDRVGQQPALVVADIARRRADQPADRVALHIFGHIKALQRDSHDRRQLAGDLGFTDLLVRAAE